jgi:guanylate kinase
MNIIKNTLENSTKISLIVILFSVGFLLTSTYLPKVENKIIENTNYITLANPVVVKQPVLESCQNIYLVFVRTSIIKTAYYGLTQFVKTETNEQINRNITTGLTEIENKRVIDTIITDSCLSNGKWKIQGILIYKVKGIEKQIFWETETFQVISQNSNNIL